ncbi:sensor of ECF-type sigma factor [Tenacibaculum haliotis]|uniref:sensor of ECF-type sigma factor n=1 Tax=Tenacibaculum haliotis TaxID=1888914 RepID=UPI0021AE8451|nr:sensor of ECF-type sigma factor [Tenacibaculum haliotis]MCT4699514.1 sensor of ECF-type sigma factor [Tenacibaculum haliotis]
MKKNILLLFLMLIAFFNSLTSEAQSKENSSKKISTYKIAFLTEKLNLTEGEAQSFWPIYNTYSKNKMALHREKRQIIKKRIYSDNGAIEDISEKDSEQILEKFQSINKQEYEMKASFHNKISKILSFKKILLLQISEHEFNRKLMRKYRGKKDTKEKTKK